MFSKYQCEFRKGFSAQHCLIAMIEKWRQSLDSGGQATAFLTDLSKGFDCIDHELLIAEINAYGFDNLSLIFIYSNLSEKSKELKLIRLLIAGQNETMEHRINKSHENSLRLIYLSDSKLTFK